MNDSDPGQSPLALTAHMGATDYWNDSCAVGELRYAIARGAVGATSNPSIVVEVLGKEREYWQPRVLELASANPTWNEVDIAWKIYEEMVARGAGTLAAIHEREHARKGWQSIQTNPANYRDPARMVEQGVRFASLAPNLQVKFPATKAGMVAIEEAIARGVNPNATVSFTVSQVVAAAEAAERGLDRLERSGGDPARLAPIATIMMGRLDDWLKVVVDRDGLSVDPGALNWAGIAVLKRAYAIFRERGYRSRLLGAAYRHHLHWTEIAGGALSMTIPHAWQVRFNNSGIVPVPRIDAPVDTSILTELSRIPDFQRAYAQDGLTPDEFDSYGASVRTLRSFIAATHDLTSAIRDIVLPVPDHQPPPSAPAHARVTAGAVR
jgi:transaldolase